MVKILLCEDDAALLSILTIALRRQGFEVTGAKDGEEGLDAFYKGSYQMVISDIMMPKLDGFMLAEEIRSTNTDIPLLFMSAKDDKQSKMFGYRIGIDDYIVKPFDIDIFVAKVHAMLRRAKIENEKELTVGNFTMNIEQRSALVNGEEISLTVREFDLLFKLLSYPKKTFTRSMLMEEFWDYDSSATSRTVDVYMAKLRDKTAECSGFEIMTVHGLGYKAVIK